MIERVLFAGMLAATAGARGALALRAALARRRDPPPVEGPLRVLLLAHHPSENAGTRHRLLHWERRLRADGHAVRTLLPTDSERALRLYHDWRPGARAEYHVRALARRTAGLFGAGRPHVAVIHLSDVPHWDRGVPFVARALRRLAGRVLLDLDDLPVVGGRTEPAPRARLLVDAVDGLMLGNRTLSGHFPGKPWWHVPTCVEPAEWPGAGAAGDSGPDPLLRLVWIGTRGNLPALEALAPALAPVCAEHGATVRVICDRPADLPGVSVEDVAWSVASEQQALAGAHVGLSPLPDTPVTRCKCGLKALQYMAAGLPVVASPVGVLARIVRHGETGYLAEGPEEWAASLRRLAEDPGERARMGAAARSDVERLWSFEAHRARFLDALRGVRPEPPGAAAGES